MLAASLSSLLSAGATIAAATVLARQVRKPTWLPGQMFARLMNASHSSLTAWGLGHLTIARDATVLDVGCGGGRTVQRLAALASDGKVVGVDYASGSVAVAKSTNRAAIAAGRVAIERASVSQLPFPDRTFDVATAIETHYYWPDLVNDLREVRRVLRPGARLAIIAEAYRGSSGADVLAMRLLGSKLLTVEEHRAALLAAGFVDVVADEERRRGWLCVVASAPP